MIADKPSGISVHRGWDASRDTVSSRLREQLGGWVYPVHRLDRGTSGALIVALDPETAGRLSACFREGAVEKDYVALARGRIESAGTIDHPIRLENGRRADAITDYEPIAIARDRYTLVRLRPRTGRPHQLRRHLKHLDRHLLGDTTHGDGHENRKLRAEVGLHRLALHARRIAFPHPGSGERIEASAPLPEDLRAPLLALGFDPSLLA